jgi:hypothetical protein
MKPDKAPVTINGLHEGIFISGQYMIFCHKKRYQDEEILDIKLLSGR